MVAIFLEVKKNSRYCLVHGKWFTFHFLTGFSRWIMVSNDLCLVRCVEMADGHCVSTCQEQSQVSLCTLSPGFVVRFSWKMVHTRQVLVSS